MEDNKYNSDTDSYIDLTELATYIWGKKLVILLFVSLVVFVSVFFLLSLPDEYRAQTKVVGTSNEGQSGLSSIADQFGGLASLAGVNIPKGVGDSTDLTLEYLKSKSFIIQFVRKHELDVLLLGVKDWDVSRNTPVYDEEAFNAENNKWVRDVSYPYEPEPSDLELYSSFMNKLSVEEDEDTGVIVISFDYYSPRIAKELLDKLIEDLNLFIKTKDQAESRKSIEYLNEELSTTEFNEGRNILYQLLEEQSKKLMFTEIRAEYALKILDPPITPEIKIRPKRSLILVLICILSVLFIIVLLALKFQFTERK